jgi:putative effector of murein hydrolase LrgA (UPF0299 family)
MQHPADWKIIAFATIAGPLLTAIAVGVISLAASMSGTLDLTDIPAALKIFYLFGAVPGLIGGCIFALIRRYVGEKLWLAALSGFLGVFLPVLFIPTDGSIASYIELAQLAAFLGVIPALLTYQVAQRVFGWTSHGTDRAN